MSKTTTFERFSCQQVLQWFKDEAGKTNVTVQLHEDLVKEEDDYLYLPVHVPNKDAFEVADFLQKIEDKWNDLEPERLPRLLLVPTKD